MAQFIVTLNADTIGVRYIDRRAAMRAAFTAIADGATAPDGPISDAVRPLTTGRTGSLASDTYRLTDGTLSPATDIHRHRAAHGVYSGRALTDAKWRRIGRDEMARFRTRQTVGNLDQTDMESVMAESAYRRMTGRADWTPDAVFADVAAGRYTGAPDA